MGIILQSWRVKQWHMQSSHLTQCICQCTVTYIYWVTPRVFIRGMLQQLLCSAHHFGSGGGGKRIIICEGLHSYIAFICMDICCYSRASGRVLVYVLWDSRWAFVSVCLPNYHLQWVTDAVMKNFFQMGNDTCFFHSASECCSCCCCVCVHSVCFF